MHRDGEDSVGSPTASNAADTLAWSRLRRACRELTGGGGRAALTRLVSVTLEASGFERAFLVIAPEKETASREPYSLQAESSTRSDGRRRPSRSLLRRALATSARCSTIDLATLLPNSDASVRSLSLRSVLAVPIPVALPSRAALVLDSRNPSVRAEPPRQDLLETFAALIAVALRLGPVTRATEGPPPPAERVVLVGRSATFCRMTDWLKRIAASELPVVIQGESGTGKEPVSREIHRLSRRNGGPFVAVNCTALPETLLEAELFGSRRGAYTGSDRDRPGLFRLAHGGTLLLDEVGDMPLAMQAKLLRAIQERRVRPLGDTDEVSVDVRLLAASHRDLDRAVAEGTFRADLYFRLAVLNVEVPPLRDRFDDLPLLVEHLAPRLSLETGLPLPRLTPAAWEALRHYDWPGNVRELHAVLARAMIRAGVESVDECHLGLASPLRPRARSGDAPGDLEREMIRSALAGEGGSIAAAARQIGWSRQKLYRRVRDLGVPRARLSEPAAPYEICRAASQSRRGTTSSDSSTFQYASSRNVRHSS